MSIMVACDMVIAASLLVFEYLVGAGFHCLWWLHWILRLKGFVVFVVWDDVCHKYVCLPGFRLINGSPKGVEGRAVVVRPMLVVGF